MNLNQDIVPCNLEEAIKVLKEGLTKEDIEVIKAPKFNAVEVHFSVGTMLRNEWTLWDKDTVLVKWFEKNYGITHADDVSGLILDCLCKDIRGEPRKDKELAKQFIEHWKKQEKKKK